MDIKLHSQNLRCFRWFSFLQCKLSAASFCFYLVYYYSQYGNSPGVTRPENCSLFLSFFLFIYLFIYLFMAVLGLRFCARAFSSRGEWGPLFIAVRPFLLRSTGSRRAGSVVVAHEPSCSAACGIFPDHGSNPCPLHWQADSQPLRHQGSPAASFLNYDTRAGPCGTADFHNDFRHPPTQIIKISGKIFDASESGNYAKGERLNPEDSH